MNDKKILLESLAMDLKRVALGLRRGSLTLADRFKAEALKRESELEKQKLNGYLKNLIIRSREVLKRNDKKTADDILMFSILFQNFAQKYFNRNDS